MGRWILRWPNDDRECWQPNHHPPLEVVGPDPGLAQMQVVRPDRGQRVAPAPIPVPVQAVMFKMLR
jgi:hypothetical protein